MLRPVSCTPFLIILCLIGGIYVVRIGDLITVDFVDRTEKPTTEENGIPEDDIHSWNIDDSLDHLMWFVQITDLHLSYFSDFDRTRQLKEFCSVNVRAIQPKVVLASGDLTDGKTKTAFGSSQFEDEWRIYKDVLFSTSVLNSTKWLDVRGNHDNFDVVSRNSTKNYFRKYSIQGASHPRSYMYQHKDGNDTYSFIAVDACLEPGPRWPFNFMGLLDEKEMGLLEKYELQARSSSNATIWFGHYPTSSIFSPTPGIRHLMRHGLAYLCGHFHTFYGMVPHMYAFQKSGILELELGDWKKSRLYRIVAVDHNLLSFVDVRHSEWPVILITNPKNALYLNPIREPVQKLLYSTHIRILVFSPKEIAAVTVQIDGGHREACRHVGRSPLYVFPWNPNLYADGVHDISVEAQDVSGGTNVVAQTFSLDGSRISLDVLPRVVLMGFLPLAGEVLLGLSLCLAVLPLCWIRLMHHYIRIGRLARPRYSSRCVHSFMRKLWLVSTVDRMFYPLVVMAVYVPIGPWFFGEILENQTGFCFAWGMYVNGRFVPTGMTFLFAVIHMWTFNIPLMFLLARSLDQQYRRRMAPYPTSSFTCYIVGHLPFLTFVVFNGFITLLTIPAYGIMAFFLNPFQTWSFVLAILLWWSIVYMPEVRFRHLNGIFPVPGYSSHRDDTVSLRQYEHAPCAD